jgi:hypothetical protein
MPRNIARRSTVNFHRRVALILATGSEMPDPCDRCKKEGLRCVVELSTGYCAYCIRARSRCSLVFSDTERGEIDREERAKRVLLLQAEADAARLRLELELLKEKRYRREREEIAATEELERLEDEAGMPKASLSPEPVTRTADSDFLEPEPLADLGWSQADFNSFVDPSFLDASLLLPPWDFELGGSFGGILSPRPELPVSSGA